MTLLELARTEYEKVVQQNNLLKRQLLDLKSTQPTKTQQKTNKKEISH